MNEISIIVPIYNSEKHIAECINSILNQNYKKFELILINDGSTDNTINIIKGFKDKRIKLYNQENKGTGSARNLGLKHATGNYIIFIDSDDMIKENYVEIMLENIKKYSADIVATTYKKHYTMKTINILNKEKAFKYLISLPEKIPMSVVRKNI